MLDDSTDPRRVALTQAMALFWRRGADAASYPEIVAATGLSRKALYAIWPDKLSLLRDTVALYRSQVLDQAIARLDPPGPQGLRQFWDGMQDEAQEPGWSGCYLMRSAAGDLRHDPVVQQHFRDYADDLQSRLRDALVVSGRGSARARINARALFGILTLISTLGGQTGYDRQVEDLFAAARDLSGL